MAFIDHIHPEDFDISVLPSDDFYRHVNGGWLAANPVPAEYPAWGAAFEVHVRNEDALHRILQEASGEAASEGTPVQMVGDYFAAGMDEASIALAGIAPLQPYLDSIAAIVDLESLAETLIVLHRIGVGALHSLSVASDFDAADKYLVYLGQGGLGLPERDYYLRDDDRSAGLVAAYTAHVATQLANLGESDPEAAAEDVVTLEKRLAEASLPA
jgi:putative endopeptidase